MTAIPSEILDISGAKSSSHSGISVNSKNIRPRNLLSFNPCFCGTSPPILPYYSCLLIIFVNRKESEFLY